MTGNHKVTKDLIRIGKYLNEITVVKDKKGKVLHELVKPAMFEFYLRDVVQVIVGATLLAIPVAFTEEVWVLGQELPWTNIGGLMAMSLSFIAIFVYYNYYKGVFAKNIVNFSKRVLTTYFLSLLLVGVMLTIIDRADWMNAAELAFKRIFIIAFPASMSATVADSIK